jgi:hypothetical protein
MSAHLKIRPVQAVGKLEKRMRLLTSSAIDRASEFVQRVGRPLEQAQLRYYFGDGTVDEVLGELSKFQNDDCGFGHAMEPDIRKPNSSPLCSSIFQKKYNFMHRCFLYAWGKFCLWTLPREFWTKLARAAHLAVSENEEDWRGYGGRPLWIAAAPSSLLASEFSASVEKQLDFEIESQNAEGGWLPFWSYGDRAAVLQEATNEWPGWLTLRNRIAFKSRGRI